MTAAERRTGRDGGQGEDKGADEGEDKGMLTGDVSLDDFLPYLLNRISNRLNIDLSEDLRAIGMTLPQWRVLAVLKAGDGRNIGELSVFTVIEQSTLSRIVDRMEQAALVRRRPDADDARVTKVFIAVEGEAAFEKILKIAMRHYRRAVEGLAPDDVDTLVKYLHRVLDNIRRSPYP